MYYIGIIYIQGRKFFSASFVSLRLRFGSHILAAQRSSAPFLLSSSSLPVPPPPFSSPTPFPNEPPLPSTTYTDTENNGLIWLGLAWYRYE